MPAANGAGRNRAPDEELAVANTATDVDWLLHGMAVTLLELDGGSARQPGAQPESAVDGALKSLSVGAEQLEAMAIAQGRYLMELLARAIADHIDGIRSGQRAPARLDAVFHALDGIDQLHRETQSVSAGEIEDLLQALGSSRPTNQEPRGKEKGASSRHTPGENGQARGPFVAR